MTIYLDCNATTPVDPRVAEVVEHHLREEYGNAGSRTHEYGQRAKKAVQRARDAVAAVVGAERGEVLFTSGATESNNLALLGLSQFGAERGLKHVVTTEVEHKAVLVPVAQLEKRGFRATRVKSDALGCIDAKEVLSAVGDDTLFVSVMHVNNETGAIQPIEAIAESLEGCQAYLHIDAAQSFGKLLPPLRHPRIDLISVSGHKIYGPKGIGALVARRRGFERPPLTPLMWGGGQERGLRAGTLPVGLVAGLGRAAELAGKEHEQRQARCLAFRDELLARLRPLEPILNGALETTLYNTVNLRFPGLDSEAVMVALKGLVAISNGSACTSSSYAPSHVLLAMGLDETEAEESLRLSWCHTTERPDWDAIVGVIASLR